ncbi:hypothetical protein AA0114_g870 [Alternaria tenuissima]|uniref:Uncharacterized protein n=1 Tax=Alternaria tenuissima TaxID=119927 RepID=A0A4Q4MWU1_9PLEO|nr:hypothetical protein AA0114_g870 [Alternaria tenuissima]
MNTSVTIDDIDMLCAPVMTDRKRSSKKRVVKNIPINKAHVTRRPFHHRGEPHSAVKAKYLQTKTPLRMDIAPLPRSRLAQKPLGLRFTKSKSSWKTLLHAYMLEMSYLRDVEMWNLFNSIPCAQYDKMDCEYDTMDSCFAYYVSYGVFGSPSPAFGVSTTSTNSFGSSTESGGAVSTFSAATRSCPATSPLYPALLPPSVPVPALSQPPKPANTVVLQPPQFTGLGYLPSRRLTSETVTLPKPAEMSKDEVSAKSPSISPPKPTPCVVLPPTPASQCEEVEETSERVQPLAPADTTKPAMSIPPVEDTKSSVTPSSMVDTEPAVSSTLLESIKVAGPLPSMENGKPAVSPPPMADANAPTETSRQKSRPRGRALVTLVKPEEASKQEVELGMGSFASSNIQSPEAQISAFSDPHFKQLFSGEMKTLRVSLSKQEDIQGSQVIFLLRSLKWITDSHEAGWFEDDIELEDDAADWRGKLNILMAKLETYAGLDANSIVSNTRIQLEKVFVILGGAENIDQEVA